MECRRTNRSANRVCAYDGPAEHSESGIQDADVLSGAISLITLLLLDLAIIMVVIRPVTRLARTADLISNGDLNVPEIPVKGSDEIADLARSFNRMYLSLVKAIRMLES